MQDLNKDKTIICLGHDENALMFNAIGINGLVINDPKSIKDKVDNLTKDGIKIFLVSDKFTNEIDEIRTIYKGAYPIFLLIPLDGNINGQGVERIRLNVEKATGINLF